ncbi:uncharacterized protein N0V89_005239 [Didymosphaeria variabile]|uniref:CCCH zinc finger and RRM domain-containing protein n=1 Tax=Didymosphaeria variabile TaxID=1932322 RepID=A0A9W8XL45_9PLEO|nr:uncharacterized protein N0V89_005239 [Didymosphaeria variabile]KAJ4353509.1 hypothetical protein N0V89_005239 [Didymosphaeria variabile]
MQLLEHDKFAFKQWLLPKLANRTEAEPEVLADYVAELFAGEGSPADIKRASVEQLSDFLEDHTETFVDEIATAIEQKIWTRPAATEKKERKKLAAKRKAREAPRPAQPTSTPPTAPKAATATSSSITRPSLSTLVPDAPVFVPRGQAIPTAPLSHDASIPTGPRADRNLKKVQNGFQAQSRKRKLQERDTGGENVADSSASERPLKQLARRGGGHAGRNGQRADPTVARAGLLSNVTPFTPGSFAGQQPPALPPFDSDSFNPFNFLADLSAMMSMSYSGQALGAQTPILPHINPAAATIKCVDYETKGICHMGTLCPYNHGKAVIVPADAEYDPNNASLAMLPHSNGHRTSNANNGDRSGHQRRELGRAAFSQSGPSRGSEDTLVVGQIPEDHLTEQHVRDFFSQFGAIVDVQMRTDSRLAIVKFSDHPVAQRAYDSPKAIFDNRFVKVYWYKPEVQQQRVGTNGVLKRTSAQDGMPAIYNEDEDMIDMEEFSKQQAQLQKEFEQRRQKTEEATARSSLLSAQLEAKEDQLTELRSTLIEKARAKGLEAIITKEQRVPSGDLEDLQAEAAGLFANAGPLDAPMNPRGGFTNGRGSFRGGFRGRGKARGGRGGVVRLDNRPRSLAIAGVEAGSEKEKMLKRQLLNAMGCTGVYPYGERANTLVVGFEQRFQAEIFLNEAFRIPNVSVGDLSWVPKDATVVQQSIESDEPVVLHQDTDDEVSDGQMDVKVEVDLDVADDDDQWL